MVEMGVNMRGFVERCVEQVREELLEVAATGGDTLPLVEMATKLQTAYEQMKQSAVVQLPLEIMVIESTGVEKAKPAPPKTSLTKDTPTEARAQEMVGVKAGRGAETVEVDSPKGNYAVSDLTNQWGNILKMVKPKNHSVEALLRSTRPIGFDGQSLELEVFYKFHLDKLATEKCREIVETSVAEVFGLGGPVRLALKLGERRPVATDGEGARKDGKYQDTKVVEELGGVVEEDIIRAAQEIFKAEVI
jgi:hypothetical protein